MTHRRWDWDWNSGYKAEHNALYDAYEAERQRAEEAEAALATEREIAKLTVRADIHASVCRERDRLAARVKELETRAEVPPNIPSVEELRGVYDRAYASRTGTMAEFHMEGITAVRDAVLAALPVLTWEEVKKQHREHKSFSLSNAAPDTFTGWLASRLPARLEPVAVTEEDIAEVLDDQLSMVIDMDLCKAGAAAVMSLLREKRVAEYPAEQLGRIANDLPEPIATAETLEQLAKMMDEEWQKKYGLPSFLAYATYAAEFILRAAKPEIRIDPQELLDAINSKMSWTAKYDLLNSRIRYRVELPPDNWKAAVDDALVCCDMTADSFESPREAVQALLAWHTKVDDFFSRDEMRDRQISLYQQWLLAYAYKGWVPKGAHEQALNAALSLPEYMAELNAALDAKGGE